MKQYRPIFKESGGSSEVAYERDAMQIVDISNLQWSTDMGTMTWDKVMSSYPQGWRLPTIQELYTAYVNKISGFHQSGNYWSSSTYAQNTFFAWRLDFYNGKVGNSFKTKGNYVRYVKI